MRKCGFFFIPSCFCCFGCSYINHFMFWGRFPTQCAWIQCSIFMIAEKSSYTLVHVIIFGNHSLLCAFASVVGIWYLVRLKWYILVDIFISKNYDRMHSAVNSSVFAVWIWMENAQGNEFVNVNCNQKQKHSNHTLYCIFM